MNQDLYRPFGENFSARADDFKPSESYRWVRLGVSQMMTGHLLFLPLFIAFAISLTQERGLFGPEPPAKNMQLFLIAASIGGGVATILFGIGALLLRFSPEEDEKAAVNRYLWAYGIAVAATAAGPMLGLPQLYIVRRIAAAYGSYYLLAYFPVLASNRFSQLLTWWANFTNRFLVIMIFTAIGMGVLSSLKLFPTIVFTIVLNIMMVVMYVAWMKTLWHAWQATKPTGMDFNRKQFD